MPQEIRLARKRFDRSALAAALLPMIAVLLACGVCGGSDEDGDQGCAAFRGNTEKGHFDVRYIDGDGEVEKLTPLRVGLGFETEFSVYRGAVAPDKDPVPKITSIDITPPEIATATIHAERNGVLVVRGLEEGMATATISAKRDNKNPEISDTVQIEVIKANRAFIHPCNTDGVYVRGYPGPIRARISAATRPLTGSSDFTINTDPEDAGETVLNPAPHLPSKFTPSKNAPDKVTFTLGEELERPDDARADIIDLEQIDKLELALVRAAATPRANEEYALVLTPYSKERPVCIYGKALLKVQTPSICKLRHNKGTYNLLEIEGEEVGDIAVKMLAKGACSIAATLIVGELTLELAESALELTVEAAYSSGGGGGGGFSFGD